MDRNLLRNLKDSPQSEARQYADKCAEEQAQPMSQPHGLAYRPPTTLENAKAMRTQAVELLGKLDKAIAVLEAYPEVNDTFAVLRDLNIR